MPVCLTDSPSKVQSATYAQDLETLYLASSKHLFADLSKLR